MSTKYQYQIQEASPSDASLLSAIAYQSKQHWGYPDEWMKLWKDDLTVTPEMIEKHHCCKAIHEGQVAGFAIIMKENIGYGIEHCFVLPSYIGKGCGSALLASMLGQERYHHQAFQVLADPNAVTFYKKYGFETTSYVSSKPEGRKLPFMKMNKNSF